MSIHWFKPITVKQGEATLSTHRMLLKNDDTGLVYKCPCCPCDSAWYIVTVCPCANCGNARAAFIGSPVSVDDEEVTCDYGDYDNVLVKALTMSGATSTSEDGRVSWVDCYVYPKNVVLLAIRHTTDAAPFTGTVTAEVYIDGEKARTDWSKGISQGQTIDIGDGVTGENVSTELLEVDHTFEETGGHTVDLRITFSAAVETPRSYTCRAALRIVDAGEDFDAAPWIGSVGVVPETQGIDTWDCIIEGKLPGTSEKTGMYLDILKGPFDTKEDADYVRDHWSGLIEAYAKTCVCDVDCPGDYWKVEGIEDGVLSHYSGGDGDSGAGCEYGWIEYEASLNEDFAAYLGISVSPEFVRPDGTKTSAPWSGLVPPCWILQFRPTGQQGDMDWLDDPNYEPLIGGGFWPVEPTEDCCLYDEASPYYEAEWGFTPGDEYNPSTGVPGNSADLANYNEFGGA